MSGTSTGSGPESGASSDSFLSVCVDEKKSQSQIMISSLFPKSIVKVEKSSKCIAILIKSFNVRLSDCKLGILLSDRPNFSFSN